MPQFEDIPDDPPEGFVLQLEHPIEVGKESIRELTFHKPTLGDVESVPAGASLKIGDLTEMLGRLTGKPREVIRKLRGNDGPKAVQLGAAFLRPYLTGQTGGSPQDSSAGSTDGATPTAAG